MNRERAELEDRSAKRRRLDANTDDGVTFRSLLAKVVEGSDKVKAFEDKARQLSLGLAVYREFKQHVTGSQATTVLYNAEATEAIARFIAESVAASTKTPAKDLRNHFMN